MILYILNLETFEMSLTFRMRNLYGYTTIIRLYFENSFFSIIIHNQILFPKKLFKKIVIFRDSRFPKIYNRKLAINYPQSLRSDI